MTSIASLSKVKGITNAKITQEIAMSAKEMSNDTEGRSDQAVDPKNMSYYKDHGTMLPPFDLAVWAAGKAQPATEGRPRWSKAEAPPAPGTIILVTMNGIGKALVTGYFEEEGWLGLRCRLLEPPERLRKQRGFDAYAGHIFGPEYELL